ncbi:hypothetical protein HELRODRAFT_172096 [Helobdella robusta]|uniref:Uncharacterized protein n=1 Tax=Helobdella robusta TaxID=6412 RepID=T1F508_HELRO|nr:hypothetical protein HELRODRAFT_172096 [Helobdella robusta]ESO05079.1 hypothetical protein HELRODRAFT_172096 [Helobdella robusta]
MHKKRWRRSKNNLEEGELSDSESYSSWSSTSTAISVSSSSSSKAASKKHKRRPKKKRYKKHPREHKKSNRKLPNSLKNPQAEPAFLLNNNLSQSVINLPNHFLHEGNCLSQLQYPIYPQHSNPILSPENLNRVTAIVGETISATLTNTLKSIASALLQNCLSSNNSNNPSINALSSLKFWNNFNSTLNSYINVNNSNVISNTNSISNSVKQTNFSKPTKSWLPRPPHVPSNNSKYTPYKSTNAELASLHSKNRSRRIVNSVGIEPYEFGNQVDFSVNFGKEWLCNDRNIERYGNSCHIPNNDNKKVNDINNNNFSSKNNDINNHIVKQNDGVKRIMNEKKKNYSCDNNNNDGKDSNIINSDIINNINYNSKNINNINKTGHTTAKRNSLNPNNFQIVDQTDKNELGSQQHQHQQQQQKHQQQHQQQHQSIKHQPFLHQLKQPQKHQQLY